MQGSATRRVPEWIFGVTQVPFGVVAAFTQAVMGRVLSNKGVSVDRISQIVAATLLPLTVQFLWVPLVDFGLRRKTWTILFAVLGGACLFVSLFLPLPSELGLFTWLMVLGTAAVGLTSAAANGLMAKAVAPERFGNAGGWTNIGNLGAGAFGGFVTLELASRYDTRVVAVAVFAMTALPSLAVLWVPEEAPPQRSPRQLFGGMWRDVWATIRSRPGWTGIVLCASPVGTAALIGLFSSVANDYRAPDSMVNFVNGLWNGLLTAGGCYIGGRICDLMNRRVAYMASGVLTAICGLAMAAAPLSPTTYATGVLVYYFITGLNYASFSAFVLEIVGGDKERGAASTRYTLFTAAANGAIAYVGRLDGLGHKYWGARGLLVVDAAANLIGVALLLVLMMLLARPRDRAVGAGAGTAAAE
jgi:MFS family permease